MTAMLDRFIVSEPGYRGGRPRIDGTRITVADIKQFYLLQDMSLEEIAATYNLPLAAVYAAMAYYYDHQDAIEQSIAADHAVVEVMRAQQPSLLQAKLRQLQGTE